MKLTVEKFKEVMKKKCRCCGKQLKWEYAGAYRSDCCGHVYIAKPKVVVLIEEELAC